MRRRASWAVVALLAAGSTLGACGPATPPAVIDPLAKLREEALRTGDGDAAGRLLLGELFVPGGDPGRAREARKTVDRVGAKTLYGSLARAIDDELHGRFQGAADEYLDAVVAAQTSTSIDAPLVGWYATHRLLTLRSSVASLWDRAKGVVAGALEHPGNLGWRARGELVDWWARDGWAAEAAAKSGASKPSAEKTDAPADAKGDDAASPQLEAAAKRYGCIEHARMAGPFGHLAPSDQRTRFDAERPGTWPQTFAKDPMRLEAPRVHKVERLGCALRAEGAPGVYYVETFLDLPAERDVVIAVQASLSVLVDDLEVLSRDTRVWGIWPRFGARVRLSEGRHRIVARVGGAETSIRVVAPDGTPIDAPTSDDPAPAYAVVPPKRLPDPNVLEPFATALGVPPQAGTPPSDKRDTDDPIGRVLASSLAHVEGQDDVADVLLEPLVKSPDTATGPALSLQAQFLEKDPIFPESDTRDAMKDARTQAAKKDPELWWARLWLLLDEGEKSGFSEVASKVQELTDHFREVPDILRGLGAVYARLGWKAEHARVVRVAAKRFPDDKDALHDLMTLEDEQGDAAAADAAAARLAKLDPESEIDLERALERRDFKAAIKELERLGKVRKDRKDIAARIADLLTRSGQARESFEKLEQAVQKAPGDGRARLALADARLARGEKDALGRALVDAIHAGADTKDLREAIELVEGINELSSFRLDGKDVIRAYEAAKIEMPGTAARVLDYSALWVHPDGSAKMLEHEILRIQSREGIRELAEQRPRGLLLKVRTIKKDGTIFEPEFVEGKPTLTMPHLEVGDYIETETITTTRGDGQGGKRYEGPRWFFREEKIPYFRSEFVVISPKNRPLVVETGGDVPRPLVTESGALVTRRWRVDRSPALPEEPASAPLQEFIPNVRVGWGITLADSMARTIDAASDETPRDPRLVRLARAIAEGTSPAKTSSSAKPRAQGEGTEEGDAPPAPSVSASAPIAPSARPSASPHAPLLASSEAPSRASSSKDEQARRIYRWVLANVEQGRESEPRRAIVGKSGNRTEAFLHLCRLVGITAELGVVKDRLAPAPLGPMSESEEYNSLGVRVTTDKGATWMIVRDKFAPYGYLPSAMRGQPAIALVPGAPRESTPDTGPNDGVTHEATGELRTDGSATLRLEQRYEGKYGILLRNALETMPDARLKETVESRLLPQAFPGARLVDIEIKNAESLDEPLVFVMKIELSSFGRPSPDGLVVAPNFPLRLAMLASLPKRETPLYLSEQVAARVAMKIKLKLPVGARVSSDLSKSVAELGRNSARVDDHAEGDTLVIDRVVDLPAGRVSPADYAAFQDFARRADSALHRDISIVVRR